MAPIKLPNPLFEVTNTGRIGLLHSGLQVALPYKIAAEMGWMRRAVYVCVVRNEFLRESAQKFILYVRRGQSHWHDETVAEGHDDVVLSQGSVQRKYLPLRHPEQQCVLYGPEINAGQ